MTAVVGILQACSVNTETTYYKDSSSSMESNILIQKGMLPMINLMDNNQDGAAANLSKLSTEWKSLYELQKDNKIVINPDSAQVLKKMYLKINKDQGEVYGLSLKYDKLLPYEVTSLFKQSNELKKLPLQNIGRWDGKTLSIDTGKFTSGDALKQIIGDLEHSKTKKPETKSDSIAVYGKQMAQGLIGMMKIFPVTFSNTVRFQKPIKSISGKNDYFKQIDRKTVQINFRSSDLLDGNNKMNFKDDKIVITTE